MMLIARNQYGVELRLDENRPRASLLEQAYRRSASRIYRDKKDGRTVHVGYVTPGESRGYDQEWWTFYTVKPWEHPA